MRRNIIGNKIASSACFKFPKIYRNHAKFIKHYDRQAVRNERRMICDFINQLANQSSEKLKATYKKNEFSTKHKYIPFSDILWPLIKITLDDRLTKIEPRIWSIFSSEIKHGNDLSIPEPLLVNLVERLSWCFSETLYSEFDSYRGFGTSLSSIISDKETKKRNKYDSFCLTILDSNYIDLFSKYPVLFRIFIFEVNHWLDNVIIFTNRFHSDSRKLKQFLSIDNKLIITDIEGGISDPHNGGNVVFKLVANAKHRFLYKPRSCSGEFEYQKVVNMFNSLSNDLDLRTVELLDQGEYCWVKNINNKPAQDIDGIKNYYRRIGFHLCLTYSHNTNDCHHENIIACADYPYLVDLETFATKIFFNSNSVHDAFSSHIDINESVLGTGIPPLPFDASALNGICDISGLSHKTIKPTQTVAWVNISTDRMTKKNRSRAQYDNNIPVTRSEKHVYKNYIDEIIDGFNKAYITILEHREKFIYSLLGKNCDINARVLFNDTDAYYRMLKESLNPINLTSFEIWSESLIKNQKKMEVKSCFKNLKEVVAFYEYISLSRLDLPHFIYRRKSYKLMAGNTCVQQLSQPNNSDLRLFALSEEDAELQCNLLRQSLQYTFEPK